jgi:hypothetical protein
MRVPYRKILLFTFLLFVILGLMNLWMDKEIYPHFPLQYDEAFHPKVKADVIIMGASHATHGVHPGYLEIDHLKVFNFAFNGASPLFNLNWFQKVFKANYPRPSCVIYGVHWVMFDSQFLQRRFEQDSRYFPFRFFLTELKDVKGLSTLLLNRVAFIRERKQILPRLFKKKRENEVYPVSKYYQGYIPFETQRDLDKKDLANPKIDPDQLKAFEALLGEFERDGIKVVFVEIPDYIPGRDSSTMERNMELIQKIAKERNIPFLNYGTERVTEINYNREFYVDWAHLNGKGSEAFSKLLRSDFESGEFNKCFSKARGG